APETFVSGEDPKLLSQIWWQDNHLCAVCPDCSDVRTICCGGRDHELPKVCLLQCDRRFHLDTIIFISRILFWCHTNHQRPFHLCDFCDQLPLHAAAATRSDSGAKKEKLSIFTFNFNTY